MPKVRSFLYGVTLTRQRAHDAGIIFAIESSHGFCVHWRGTPVKPVWILDMSVPNRRRLYLLFFLSGFCSLVYQMVWTRLAFASFGIITPVLSVVIAVFMLGLSIGAWAGGRIIQWLVRRTGLSAIFFYGGAEFIIGLGAFAVPGLFAQGEQLLLTSGQTDSIQYLLFSALVLAASILPWCVFMGATFPFMMAYVREQEPHNADSFSYLYFANVLGAMT